MRRVLIPYYATRALFSALFGWFLSLTWSWWVAALGGALVLAGFLWYAHSGRYLVDVSTPFFPLRRDDRAKSIRDRASVLALTVAGLVFVASTALAGLLPGLDRTGYLAILAGVVTYFLSSALIFARH